MLCGDPQVYLALRGVPLFPTLCATPSRKRGVLRVFSFVRSGFVIPTRDPRRLRLEVEGSWQYLDAEKSSGTFPGFLVCSLKFKG
jgi:hypothetical protein